MNEESRAAKKLREHLVHIHGLSPLQTDPAALHHQDHQPGHGYGGKGWEHSETDLFTRIEEDA